MSNKNFKVKNGIDVNGHEIPAWTPTPVSSNHTMSKGRNYFVDTSSAVTVTLPSSPAVGDQINVFDASANAATNNITVNSNGAKLNGSVQNLTIDVNNAAVVLIYTGSTYGWKVA